MFVQLSHPNVAISGAAPGGDVNATTETINGEESRYWRQRRGGWFAQGRRLLANASRSDGGVQKGGSRLMLQLLISTLLWGGWRLLFP